MGVRSWLRDEDVLEDSSSNGDSESRSLPRPDNELPLSGSQMIFSGPSYWQLRPVEALAIADVWAAVRVLSDAVSSLPLHVYRRTEQGRERVTAGKLVDLLRAPSPATSEADLTSSLMCHLAIYGAGYIGKYREAGEVSQLS